MSENLNKEILLVDETSIGTRLDRFLAMQLPLISRSRLKQLIKQGEVSLNGAKIEEPNYRVKPADQISVNSPEPQAALPLAQNIPLDVVFEDEHLIVINKPPGLVVHPAAGNWDGTLVNALLAHCGTSLSGIGGVKRPGIVHRLDKDTSGLMVVAKTDMAHKSLADQFANHGRDGKLKRAYKTLVWAAPRHTRGLVNAPLGRKPNNRLKQAVLKKGGRESVTHYEILQYFLKSEKGPLLSLLNCTLETGRTHQIRVHMAHIGCPVVGDQTYGSGFKTREQKLSKNSQTLLKALKRQALHAYLLGFEHPETGENLIFESNFPSDFADLLTSLTKS